MQNSAVLYRKSLHGRRPQNAIAAPPAESVRDYILTSEISRWQAEWFDDCRTRRLSQDTLDLRETILRLLCEFLDAKGLTVCGPDEARKFMLHLATSGRRQGNNPLASSTIKTYRDHLVIFFKFLLMHRIVTVSPMASTIAPAVRKSKITPFTAEQIKSMIDAAKHGYFPKRDRAIILLFLDTGMREAELAGLKWGDLDLISRRCSVVGKGNKPRDVYFSATTYRAITEYRRDETSANEDSETPLFYSDRGRKTGTGISESGLLQLVHRLGDRAGVTGVRCSPHTFRHTFALNFLRSGGDVFALKDALGHEDIKMTMVYVKMASSDHRRQHLAHSPVEFMLRGK